MRRIAGYWGFLDRNASEGGGGKGTKGDCRGDACSPRQSEACCLQAVAIAPGPPTKDGHHRLGRLRHHLRLGGPAGGGLEALDAVLVEHLVDEQLDVRQLIALLGRDEG